MKESKINLILVGLLVAAAFLIGSLWTKVKTGEVGGLTTSGAKNTPVPSIAAQPTQELLPTTIGRFNITKDEVCLENGKPIIYYFGGSFCPHCQWEHPVIEKTTKKFAGLISLHDNMDKQGVDDEVFNKYRDINGGGVPFLVFGCKYVRVGSGENDGEAVEEKNLTAILCKLTNNQPASICAGVKDLIEKVQD